MVMVSESECLLQAHNALHLKDIAESNVIEIHRSSSTIRAVPSSKRRLTLRWLWTKLLMTALPVGHHCPSQSQHTLCPYECVLEQQQQNGMERKDLVNSKEYINI